MGPLNIVLWLGGVALIAIGYTRATRPLGALPGAQGPGRQRRSLRGVAGRHPRRQQDRRLGRDGHPPAPGPDRRRDRGRRGRARLHRLPHPLTRSDAPRPPIRRHSMLVQRSITTSSPPAWATTAASQATMPSWSHSQRAPTSTASRACGRQSSLPPEDVDHVDRAGGGDRFGDGREGGHALDLALVRVDRDAVEALGQEMAEDRERGPAGVRGCPDDRDPPGRPECPFDARVVEDRDGPAALDEIEVGGRTIALLARQVAASRSYGWPSAAGGMLRPTNPARTTIVTR